MTEVSAHELFSEDVPCDTDGCEELTDRHHSLCRECRAGNSVALRVKEKLERPCDPAEILPVPKPRPEPKPLLTRRQMDVLLAMADGLENREIAAELWVEYQTVNAHVKYILQRMGARNRTHAVALGYHLGLLVPRRQAE